MRTHTHVCAPISRILREKNNKKNTFIPFWLVKGPKSKASLSPVSDFWGKLVPSLGVGFCNRCLKCWNLQKVTKINLIAFLQVFHDYCFFLKHFLHLWHCIAFYISFTWIIIDWFVNVMFAETISRWNVTKHSMFFGSKFGISTFRT